MKDILSRKSLTFGQKAADKLTGFVGSWPFIIIFILYFIVWIVANIYAIENKWDPYPFILLNLTLSVLAAIQAPIILIAQNRTSQKDRQRMQYDYNVDRHTFTEIETIKTQLNRIENKLRK